MPRACLAVVLAAAPCCQAPPSQGPTAAPRPGRSGTVDIPSADRPSGRVPPARHPSGWTTFRGDASRTGRTTVCGPRTPDLRWAFRTRGRIYADAAVAEDGTVYVASHDGRIYAVSQDGREIWSYDTGGKIWTSPAIGKDGTIYVGSDSDHLVALDPSGKERWIFATAEPVARGESVEAGRWDVDTSPLLLADGTVVFGCHTFLFALRPSGILRWRFVAGVGKAKVFSSPAAGPDGTIYFGTQGSYFFALDQSAKVLWHVKTGGDNDGTPAVGGDGTVYFGSDDGRVRAVAAGGTLRWEADLGSPIRAPLAIGHDGTIFAPTYGATPFLAAIDGQNGQVRWRFPIEPGRGDMYGIQSGPLVDCDGHVYFGGRDGYVYSLAPDGALSWRHRTGDQVDSGPVVGPDGTLYIGSDDHRLYAFGPSR